MAAAATPAIEPVARRTTRRRTAGSRSSSAATLSLSLRDNLHHGFAHVLVAPPVRRRGLGRRLLGHVTAQAVDAGRTRLALGTAVPPGAPAAGRGFLRAAGARLALTEKRRRLVVPPPRTGDAARPRGRGSPGVGGLPAGAVGRTDPDEVARRPGAPDRADVDRRRLGLRIKLANLERLRREHPEVRAVDTFNADDNRWMIAVNEAMGSVPNYELDLGPGLQAGTTAAISVAASGP